jgi:hypothetical protein
MTAARAAMEPARKVAIRARGAVAALIVIWLQACSHENRPSTITVKRNIWTGCVSSSFEQQRKMTPDANAAAEMAFQACQREEQAIFAMSDDPQYVFQASRVMAQHKANLKRDLLQMPR